MNESSYEPEDNLPEDAIDRIEKVPNNERNSQLIGRIEYTSASFTASPFPDPKILHKYNEIVPDAADRIITMVEKEQAHRQKMQEKLVDAQVLDSQRSRDEKRLGQILGFAIGLSCIAGGSFTAIKGSPWVGGVLSSSGVAGLVSVFVLGRKEQQTNQMTPQLDSSDENNENE